MSSRKSIKVIFDTNIWISFLIGKRLQSVKNLVAERQILLVISNELLLELRTVTQRDKLKKYFPEQKVEELITFLITVGQVYPDNPKNQLSRDLKDNFLLDLAEATNADFLVTGDKDLLVLNPFKNTKILTATDFEMELERLKH